MKIVQVPIKEMNKISTKTTKELEIDIRNKEGKFVKGHKRIGGGMKKGQKTAKTIERGIIKKEFENRILFNIQDLLTAQINIAKGTSYLYKIVETKKGGKEHILVEDPLEIKYVLDEIEGEGQLDNNYYYIATKQPDNRALDSLIDRVFGKAPETITHNINPIPILGGKTNDLSRSNGDKENIDPDQED